MDFDRETIGLLGLLVLLILIAIRVPIGMALISVSVGGIYVMFGERVAIGVLSSTPYEFAANWTLSSIPMFLLMGFLCYNAGLTRGLYEAARVFLAKLPGGLAIASVFAASGFAAVSGSSLACAAAMGRIAVPEMMRQKYDPALATGTVAAAGTIGALIPPSILLIVFGILATQPVDLLFAGGMMAGLLTLVGYCIVIWAMAVINPTLAPLVEEDPPPGARWAALRETWPVILLVIGVFGGLFSGLFTATEAGAVGAAMSGVIAYAKGGLTYQVVEESLMETVVTSASLFIVGIGATLLTRFLALSRAGDLIADTIIGLDANVYVLLLGITILYLIIGMFLEPLGAMLLTLPVLLPIVDAQGLSMIWFGVLVVKFLEIGMITPPIGLNVFVIKGVVGDLASLGTIFKGIMWFLVADLVIVLIMIVFPDVVMVLPDLLVELRKPA